MSRTRHRVAVVVFADVEAEYNTDAAYAVEHAIRVALTGDALTALPVQLPIPLKAIPADVTARVVALREIGTALRNGYLWADVTSQAWRQRGLDETEEDE